MRIIDKQEVKIYKKDFLNKVNSGKLFVHPTDTIYGIGCDATNDEAVSKLRNAKQRYSNPFSVIAPSKEWIQTNCHVDDEVLNNLPGPVTLILKLKNKNAISSHVNNNMDTIAVRMPDHWISNFVSDLGKPVITTSVNIQGEEFMTHPDNIHSGIKGKVDFVINEGTINGRPSKIINTLTNKKIER